MATRDRPVYVRNLEVAMFDLAMAGTGLVSLALMGAYLRLTTRL
jgi:hypothetical protein